MSIPEFNKRGVLDKGIHQCDSQEFIHRFCFGDESIRSKYKEVLQEIFAFTLSRGGNSVILAGSFVSSKLEPNDLDCMIILPNKECCLVQSNEFMVVEECELDIIVVEESSKKSIYSFLNLFSKDKLNLDVGMVEVVLDKEADKSTWDDYEYYFSVESLLLAREAYIFRHVIRGVREKKILVTITGIEEHIFFNNNIAPIVSSAGWIFAPYFYFSNQKNFSFSEEVKRLRNWLREIYTMYEANVSIYVDGAGSIILGEYMLNSQHRELEIDKIILARSLLSRDFDWLKVLGKWDLKMVCNLKSKNNEYITSESLSKIVKSNSLYGEAYRYGFKDKNNALIEYSYEYTGEIDWEQFNNVIFPMYQMTNLIRKNTETMISDNFHEIAALLRSLEPLQFDVLRENYKDR